MQEYENCFSLNRRVAGIGRWAGCPHPRIFEGAGSDFSSILSLSFLFARLCAFSPRIPIPQISPFNPLTPCLFNTFPLHSNDTKKVIDTQYTFVLLFPVFANQNLRRFVSLTPAALRPPYFRHGVEKLVTRRIFGPFFSNVCVLFHFPYPATPLFATLTKTTGVYTNNSHSGIQCPALPAIIPVLSFHALMNCPPHPHEKEPLCFHTLPNCSSRNPCVFTFMHRMGV